MLAVLSFLLNFKNLKQSVIIRPQPEQLMLLNNVSRYIHSRALYFKGCFEKRPQKNLKQTIS